MSAARANGAATASRSDTASQRRLDVDFHVIGSQLHQLASGRCLSLAHELGDLALGLREIHAAEAHLQEAPRVGVERGFPQLFGAHLAQALEAADAPGAFANAVLAQLVED